MNIEEGGIMELTIAQLAHAVGRSETYVRQHVYRKHLAVRKAGHSVSVSLDEAARWARDRGLPFDLPARAAAMTPGLRDRAARMTILTWHPSDAEPRNLFTLVRHRRSDALGPWAGDFDESWSSIDLGHQLRLMSFNASYEHCHALIDEILNSGALMIEGLEIRYALEPFPRRHWAYRDKRPLAEASVSSPFPRHSAEVTEFWSFGEAPHGHWLQVLESLGGQVSLQLARLGFPLDRRPDRVGNLMIAGAADEISCDLEANRDQTLRLHVEGDDLLPEAYRAAVWASHSGDEVLRRQVAVRPGYTAIPLTSDVDHIGFAVYRTAEGQCIDKMEVFLVKQVSIHMTLSGPKASIRNRRRRAVHEVSPWDIRSTISVRSDRDMAELDKGIRRLWLDRLAHEREAAARREGNLVRFGPDEFEEAAQHFLGLLRQFSERKEPIYLADRYFMAPFDKFETDKRQRLEQLYLKAFATTTGRPFRVLCTQKDIMLPPWWSNCPKDLTGHVKVRAFHTHDGRPGFHDRYLVTPEREVLITHSLNGWHEDGVTFICLPYGVYGAEAERLWNLDTSSGTAVLDVREIC